MRVEEMIAGVHGTEEEINFVLGIAKIIRAAGYDGDIDLVGSRAEGQWISSKAAEVAFLRSQEIKQQWLKRLNTEARTRNLCRSQIPGLLDLLGDGLPDEVIRLLEGFSLGEGSFEVLEPGSDFDFLVNKRPPGVRERYDDPITGQIIDIWEAKEVHKRSRNPFGL